MRVAMISYHTCPLATLGGKDTGGMNVYVRDLTRELGRQGVGVDVFTRSQDEHVPHVLHEMGYGNRVVHIPSGPEIPLPKPDLVQYLPEFVARIMDFASVKGIHYDVLHTHYWLSGLAGLDLQSQWNVPLIHMFHTLALVKRQVARRPEEEESEVRIQGELDLLRQANRIVAATENESAVFESLYGVTRKDIAVIPPGVDTARFYPIPHDEAFEFAEVPDENQLILFVGRIEPLKGIDTLLNAMLLLRQRGLTSPDCRLCLIIIGGDPDEGEEGDSPEMQRLLQMACEYDMDGVIRFLGKKDQDTLPYYYSAAEVVVVPSHYESFGMVALEAMACGTPVIASETGGLAYLVKNGETGFFVKAGDPAELADRLERILINNKLRETLAQNAVRYAHQFAWPAIAKQLVSLYTSEIETHRQA
ncbi:MAG: glycosyltransferase [Anaerolineales bacterium]|nr:glycosyltransferase [Anaerolineales bacterium]